jgi:hypothetical protein
VGACTYVLSEPCRYHESDRLCADDRYDGPHALDGILGDIRCAPPFSLVAAHIECAYALCDATVILQVVECFSPL